MKRIVFIFFVILFLWKNFFLIQERFFNDKARFFNDFHAYYVGSYLFWKNENPYDLHGQFAKATRDLSLHFMAGSGYSYPPLIAFLFYPLLSFSSIQAARIFAGVTMMIYLVICALIFHEQKKLSFWQLIFLAIYLATFSPATDSANHGQVNLIVLLCLYFYFRFRSWQKISSFCLVTAILIKVYPIFFILKEFAAKNFKFIVKNAIWGGGFFIILGLMGKFSLIPTYFFRVLPKINNSLDAYYTNQSINGFFSRLLLKSNNSFLISQEIYRPMTVVLTVITFLYLIFFSLKYRGEEQRLSLLWLGVSLLFAGKNSFSNFTPAVLIGIYLIVHFKKLRRAERIVFIFSIILSNYGWQFVWGFQNSFILQDTLLSKLIFVSVTSLGFYSFFLQTMILFALCKRKG